MPIVRGRLPTDWVWGNVLVIPLNREVKVWMNPFFAKSGSQFSNEQNAIVMATRAELRRQYVDHGFLDYHRDLVVGQAAIDAYRAAHPPG
jgi:hypothetical protein